MPTTRSPYIVVGALALAAIGLAIYFAWWSQQEGEPIAPPPLAVERTCAVEPEPEPQWQAPHPCKPRALDAKLVGLWRDYLDAETEFAYKHRQPLIDWLKAQKGTGRDLLGDLDMLTDVLYAARPFEMGTAAPFEEKRLPKGAKFHQELRLTSVSVPPEAPATEPLRLSMSLPASYPESKARNSVCPFPLIVTLHEKIDSADEKGSKEWPGEEVIKRRYSVKGPMKALTDEWIILAPVGTGGRFAEETDVGGGVMESKVKSGLITFPLRAVWQRYQVDFDRIVLDGGAEALELAAAQPIWFAGLIVRGDEATIAPELARNFAHLSVYVVGEEDGKTAASLRAGGLHPRVGPAYGIAAWLDQVKRKTPKAFHWTVGDPNRHILANWINVNEVAKGGTVRTLEVESVDTASNPNTVRVDAVGISRISIFLNDRIVDLDRPVRILVNGQLAIPAMKFERNLDKMFTAPRLNIRQSQYYGWLYPIQVDNIVVPEKQAGSTAKPVTPNKDDTPAPTESDRDALEAKAKGYSEKAEEAEKSGNLAKALALYQKIVSLGETSKKAAAEAKVKELSEKLGK